ncbi:MAG: zeta toxin family protein [Kiritimatiellae bacterium]|nr:zeta toxin family protein [Kiritimatiellia bacterium]
MKPQRRNGKRPVVYIIGGPNGAGKTTFALEFLPKLAGCRNFVNADLIARGLSPLDVEAAAIQAGRVFLQQIQAQVSARRDFAFESTLSGLAYAGGIKDMRRAGYEVRLYYLWIPTVQLTLKRIAERVRRGGHDIPADVARRRYGKGLSNLFKHYLPLTDYAAVFDNSSASPALVYEKTPAGERVVLPVLFGRILKQAEPQ